MAGRCTLEMIGIMDTGDCDAYFVILPSAPGDLVATRSLLAQICLKGRTTLATRKALTPLIEDLPHQRVDHSFDWVFNDNPVPWTRQQKIRLFNKCMKTVLVDLFGSPALSEFIREYKLTAWGHDFSDCKNPYERCVPWRLMQHDRSHYAVRMLRLLPGFDNLTQWPDTIFEKSFFRRDGLKPNKMRLALMPGCGTAGAEKRMSKRFWINVAQYARSQGLTPVWFLGPDEQDLEDSLVRTGDVLVTGEWSASLLAHTECECGIANDTSHVHVRVHLQRHTIVLYKRGEYEEWGSYPAYVIPIMPETANEENFAIGAINAHINHFVAVTKPNTI